MGTKGLLTAFISAFITVIVYNFFIKRNITIKMPKEVPPNISQVFKDIFPLSAVIIIIYALDLLSRTFIHTNVANAVLKSLNHYLLRQMAGLVSHLSSVLSHFLVCRYTWSIYC